MSIIKIFLSSIQRGLKIKFEETPHRGCGLKIDETTKLHTLSEGKKRGKRKRSR